MVGTSVPIGIVMLTTIDAVNTQTHTS